MKRAHSPLGFFERYLSFWVALCIAADVGSGSAIPDLFQAIVGLEYAQINLVVAVLIWTMIYPMMVNVDFASGRKVDRKPKGLCITLVVNWLIKSFTMAALGILFFEYLFAGLVQPDTVKEYIAGMILLGVAPCTAMVFVWGQMVRGDAGHSSDRHSLTDAKLWHFLYCVWLGVSLATPFSYCRSRCADWYVQFL